MSRFFTVVAFITAIALSVPAKSKPRTKPVTDAEVARINAVKVRTNTDMIDTAKLCASRG